MYNTLLGLIEKPNCESLDYYLLLKKELKSIASAFPARLEQLTEQYSGKIVGRDYSKYGSVGGTVFGGYYCPDPTWDIGIGNSKAGELIGSKRSRKKADIEYGFDESGRILIVKALKSAFNEIAAVQYFDNISIWTECVNEPPDKSKPAVSVIAIFRYDEQGKTDYCIEAESVWRKGIFNTLSAKRLQYDEDKLIAFDVYQPCYPIFHTPYVEKTHYSTPNGKTWKYDFPIKIYAN